MKVGVLHDTTPDQEKTLLLCAVVHGQCELSDEGFEQEFISLIKTLEVRSDDFLFMPLRRVDKSRFLTKGKLEDLVFRCQENQIQRIILSWPLSPMQKRNLEDALSVSIWDRNDLILNIFRKAAVSREGQIQVKMADIELEKSRLSGHGSSMGQQQAGTGSRGPGETEKEYRTRFLKTIYAQARKELEHLERTRATQRKSRLESNLPLLSLVGYTNVGKSSLMNLLTGSSVLAEDKLFATLDTTVRKMFLKKDKFALVSDTIGFISNLPPVLIKAFHSTLAELTFASCLLLVVDLSETSWRDQTRVVLETLSDIEVSKPIIYVFNKIDRLSAEHLAELKQEIALSDLKPAVFISVAKEIGIDSLKSQILKSLASRPLT